MYKVVIIGGGWSGCAAAVSARKAGAEVVLLEKTDLLLGLGNVGGIMRNNGRFTAAEENIALGAKELFGITDQCSRHVNVDFPGHKHASLYDVMRVEPQVRRLLLEMGVEIHLMARAIDVEMETIELPGEQPRKYLKSIILADGSGVAVGKKTGEFKIEGDVFVECTGSTGPMGNCLAYGNGCCMCILRCPAFGPRVSISQKAGVNDIMGMRKDGAWGAFSGSGKLEKDSLSEEIQRVLNDTGVAVIPLEKKDIVKEKLNLKVCQQYALDEYAENIVLLDTGYAKIMTPFFPLEKLRQVEGFENARYADPYAGGKGNSIRYLSVTEREDNMKVAGIENLLCGGEKSGLFVGHTEAITTGSLAGYNAARYLKGLKPMELPRQLATGDLIAYANERLKTSEGLMTRYTFAGAEYFKRMQERELYSINPEEVTNRVARSGLKGIYSEKMI
ncbi:FAD-dependent oxidoreductase [Clostridium aminobutyricum]|uniref:FAD-dependent oxidoreductase n=1 Tax=Clostridium aminobutyricum TaxID=33953 RepID=A0A939IIY2_CLOAM|nr:FAD-dependent oxidoreductase [Clostridium aminobutyricum]MBN7773038.1 FAD-dependent oxidoreductase [Clostridium aminobutyricum]